MNTIESTLLEKAISEKDHINFVLECKEKLRNDNIVPFTKISEPVISFTIILQKNNIYKAKNVVLYFTQDVISPDKWFVKYQKPIGTTVDTFEESSCCLDYKITDKMSNYNRDISVYLSF